MSLHTITDAQRTMLQQFLSHRSVQRQMAAPSGIAPRTANGPAPLLLAQERIWHRAQTRDLPPLYNESITIHREGPLDLPLLQRCLSEIVRRHEIWRTTFELVDGRPAQIVQPPLEAVPLPFTDLRSLPQSLRDSEARRLATADACQHFDLASGPLFRARVTQLEDEYYRLSMAVHQIVLDGVSVYRVLLSELSELYNAFSARHKSPLPLLPIQCSDFATWQHDWLQGDVLIEQVEYWRSQLAGCVGVLNWPRYRPRPTSQSFRGRIHPFALASDLANAAKRLSQQEGVTLFTTLTTAFVILLHRYAAQDDIIVGTVAPAGRKRSEALHLLGYFLNPVALRLRVSDSDSSRDLLRQSREVISGALSHDDVPFEYVVDQLAPAPDPSRNPFFQVAISLEPPLAQIPGWSLTPMDAQSGGARWDLYLVLDDRPDELLGRVQYNPDLFEPTDIDSFIRDYGHMLKAISAAPGESIAALPPSPSQKRRTACTE